MLPKPPDLPPSKIYKEKMTPEQLVTFKLVHKEKISSEEEDVLKEAIQFYRQVYPYFKSINLSEITDEEAMELLAYLKKVFNAIIYVQNKVRFENTYRVSIASENFLEKGKVRLVKYLREPTLEINKARGVYGRANSPDSTVFYSTENPVVALIETKPKIGDRLIIGHWKHNFDEPFLMYPITNSKEVRNELLDKATKAFQDQMQYNHPLLAEILDLYFEFVSSEFVKESEIKNPRKYEYLFSSYFADSVLKKHKPSEQVLEPIGQYDAIIYPSIADKYRTKNLAIIPESVQKLRPEKFTDCVVTAIKDEGSVLYGYQLPYTIEILRTSYWIEDGLIIWDDD